jgi:hypothetical protein
MNVDLPDVKLPFNGGALTPGGGWITNVIADISGGTTNYVTNAVHYDYILDDGNFELSELDGSVYVQGKAALYVTSELNLSSLDIQPGKKLNLYCAAPSANLSGHTTGDVDGTADDFIFWGLPSCTSINLNGNAGFVGAIYAPSAALTLSGGTNITDFVGATITASARLNGKFSFHYDEALAKIGPSRGWIVTSWNEISPSEVPSPPTY